MKLTQRNVTMMILVILAVLTGVIVCLQLIGRDPSTVVIGLTATSFVISTILAIAYWRGWTPASLIQMVLITIITGMAFGQTTIVGYALAIPPVLAVILAPPLWILFVGLATFGIAAYATNWQASFVSGPEFFVYVVLVLAIYVGRLFTESLRREAEENARRAEDERAQVVQQAADLAESNRKQEVQLEEQRRLLELVTTLETPSVQLADGVLFAPVVGNLDSARAARLTERLLKDVHEQRARLVVLDIAGVTSVDTSVARSLLNTAQSLRLLGCAVTISGITAEVALTLTTLGVGFAHVTTVRSPQEALANWMGRGV